MNPISIKKLHSRIENLQNEVCLLRSTLVGLIAKDKEGEYNPAFVKKILKAAEEKPTFRFTNAKDFLSSFKRI